jgi:DNA-binding SARP family transcriptional activator
VEFLLLGRVEAHDNNGQRIALGRRRERCLLGLLLLNAGQPVPAERLISLLWEESQPRDARATLRTYLSRLRVRVDGGVQLIVDRGGYLAEVDPTTVDTHRFGQLVQQARAEEDQASRARLLGQALALWRGPLLADVASETLRQRVGTELTELRLAAIQMYVDAEFAVGRLHELIGPLSTMVAEHPLHEPLVERLMLALHRIGRHAEALDAYQRLRARLADALGTDPGPDLQRCYLSILRQEPGQAAPGPSREPAAAPMLAVVPAQLPPTVRRFTGRHDALSELDALLATAPTDRGPIVISALSGTAGVGKTALAVHWAHLVATEFPDGQLYVNLRGYGPSQPMRSEVALAGFLRALGVEAEAIPLDLHEQSGMLRSLLAGRRMLMLLDNARSAEQIRPLLPGVGGSLVLVTSRDDLAGLVVRDGAHRLTLDRLPAPEAVELLRRILSDERVDREPEAAAVLARFCAGLPLALRVAAERAARHPGVPLSDIAARLAARTHRLDALDVPDDPTSAAREVFSWSYVALPPGPARLFRLLGVLNAPDICVATAGRLLDVPDSVAADTLDALGRAHLVEQHQAGRFRMHDLLRLFAIERAAAEEPPGERAEVLRRVARWQLRLAREAHWLIFPALTPELEPAEPVLRSASEALSWFATERHNLLSTASWVTTEPECRPLAEAFLLTLHQLVGIEGYSYEWEEILGDALHVARLDGDNGLVATILERRAHLQARRGDLAAAADTNAAAAEILRTIDEPDRELTARMNEAVNWHRLGRPREAARLYRSGLDIARALKNQRLEAYALTNLAAVEREIGHHHTAIAHASAARDIFHALNDWQGEADALDDLADTWRAAGESAACIEARRRALSIIDGRDRTREGQCLHRLSVDLQATGRTAEAIEALSQAVQALTEAGVPEAAAAQRSLAALEADLPEDGT